MEKNIFEFATRNRLRFSFKGMLPVEELWNLSLEELDSIFKQLNSTAKQASEESLLNKKTAEDEVVAIKIEIIKHIVKVKLDEQNARLRAKSINDERQRLLAIANHKKDAETLEKSYDEIMKMVEALDQ